MCQDSADIIAINAVGSRILELIDGHKSIDDCLAILLKEFEVEPIQLQRDCLDFISDLVQNDILESV
ncbi:MAG TPA: PqqD family protein [Acidiferrobacteraceae bacterium]|nr:PqqD family protein [Acidiferrobacteraceae bacterium]